MAHANPTGEADAKEPTRAAAFSAFPPSRFSEPALPSSYPSVRPATRGQTSRRWRWGGAGARLLFCVAAAWFFCLCFGLTNRPRLWDFGIVYSMSGVWADGGNPYDLTMVWRHWWTDLGGLEGVPYFGDFPLLVAPSVLPAVWVYTLLPPSAAARVWLAVSLLLLAGALAALLSMGQLRRSAMAGWLLPALALGMAPFQLGVITGQVALWAAAGLILAAWIECRSAGRSQHGSRSAGVILGIATALKPQLAGPFIIYCLWRRRWRSGSWAIAVFAAFLGIGLLKLHASGIPWLTSWRHNMMAISAPGAGNDFDFRNKTRDDLVQLQVLLWAITRNRAATNVLAWVVTTITGLVYAFVLLRRSGTASPPCELLSLAPLAALTLLPVYHRQYDAAILLIPLAWALSRLARPRADGASCWPAWMVVLSMLSFLPPLNFWGHLADSRWLVQLAGTHVVWNLLIIPMHSWAILAILTATLAAMWQENKVKGAKEKAP